MAKHEITMPQMGESIIEATIIKWLKAEGEPVEEDESLVEVATDKVDSEIPSPVEGTLSKQLVQEGDVVPVGTVIAIIETAAKEQVSTEKVKKAAPPKAAAGEKPASRPVEKAAEEAQVAATGFLSPLVKTIAKEENISPEELKNIAGSGKDGRITKDDLLAYLKKRSAPKAEPAPAPAPAKKQVPIANNDEVIVMDRIRKLTAEHMVMSKRTSAHVTSSTEVDMTHVVRWREKMKKIFEKRDKVKLTYTPIITELLAKALKEFPRLNSSVDEERIILHKAINIGIATALANGNLIVPVVKNVDMKSLTAIAREINDLANRARENKLKPDEIAGGTFTVTNYGTVGTDFGTPIINQPQVAILGTGAIKKRPMVLETPEGDSIVIRHMMWLSLSYDHRVIDGAVAGTFLKRLKELLENFDAD